MAAVPSEKNGQNGHFYLQFYDADGKRKTITLKTLTGQHITEQRAAETAAREFMERLKKIQDIETHEDYLEERARLKKLKARLTITLDDAFDLHLLKPHTRIASNQVENVNRRYWFDFVSFLHDRHGLTTLDQVEREHAEEYIAYIRKFGRWNRKIRYHQEKCPKRKVNRITDLLISNSRHSR